MSKTILIIDDDEDMVALTSLFLSNNGYNVAYAYNGFEGLKRVKEVHPDLIILDLNMPEIDGHQVSVILKNDYPEIPIVMLSARNSPEHIYRAEKDGIVEYLNKPIDEEKLTGTLDKILSKAKE